MTLGLFGWLGLVGATLRGLLLPPTALPDIIRTIRLQVLFTFVHAVPAVTILSALGAGFALLLRGSYGGLLTELSPDSPLGRLLLDLALGEAVPIAAGVVIAARSGTAVAAELAAAWVGDEVEAIADLGVDPIQFWVVPRVLGLALSTVLLTLYLLLTVLVLYWIAGSTALDFRGFLSGALAAGDVSVVAAKAAIAGAGLGVIASGYGLVATNSVSDLPRAASAATMTGVIWCVTSSLLITAALVGR